MIPAIRLTARRWSISNSSLRQPYSSTTSAASSSNRLASTSSNSSNSSNSILLNSVIKPEPWPRSTHSYSSTKSIYSTLQSSSIPSSVIPIPSSQRYLSISSTLHQPRSPRKFNFGEESDQDHLKEEEQEGDKSMQAKDGDKPIEKQDSGKPTTPTEEDSKKNEKKDVEKEEESSKSGSKSSVTSSSSSSSTTGGSSSSSGSSNSLTKQTVPSVYPQVLALLITRRPLFPGFYKAVVIKNPAVCAAIRESMKRGQPYVGAFLLRDEEDDSDVITDLSKVHRTGVFCQITNVFQLRVVGLMDLDQRRIRRKSRWQ